MIMYNNLLFILAQIDLEGFKEAAEMNTLFGVLVSIILILFTALVYIFKLKEKATHEKNSAIVKHSDEKESLQKEHALKINEITNNFLEKLERLRLEYEGKEEEMIKYQREAEKETLNVLNGVNKVLEMSDKMKENDTQKIISAIKNLEEKLKK